MSILSHWARFLNQILHQEKCKIRDNFATFSNYYWKCDFGLQIYKLYYISGKGHSPVPKHLFFFYKVYKWPLTPPPLPRFLKLWAPLMPQKSLFIQIPSCQKAFATYKIWGKIFINPPLFYKLYKKQVFWYRRASLREDLG